MKKTILTTVIALFCLSASAQFSVMSSVSTPLESEGWNLDSITNNIALGYQVNDKIMVGVQKNGENYDVIGRYSLSGNMYVSAQAPTKDVMENLTLGLGISIRVWDELYIEPNYTRKDEEGSFNVGLSYKL